MNHDPLGFDSIFKARDSEPKIEVTSETKPLRAARVVRKKRRKGSPKIKEIEAGLLEKEDVRGWPDIDVPGEIFGPPKGQIRHIGIEGHLYIAFTKWREEHGNPRTGTAARELIITGLIAEGYLPRSFRSPGYIQ